MNNHVHLIAVSDKDPERKKAYQKQLEIYAKYWAELTEEPVKEQILLKVG
ncbi:MAG: hypothetical protein PHV17_06830 [Candidatus Omnitrophica bacterium]|nr:hypothetical protein [Candidatus Omnitrophota bacterium]